MGVKTAAALWFPGNPALSGQFFSNRKPLFDRSGGGLLVGDRVMHFHGLSDRYRMRFDHNPHRFPNRRNNRRRNLYRNRHRARLPSRLILTLTLSSLTLTLSSTVDLIGVSKVRGQNMLRLPLDLVLPGHLFVRVVSVAMDRHQHLLVADAGAYYVPRFSARGAPIDTLGQRGNGPGKFQPLTRIACPPEGDWLFVLEELSRRMHRWHLDPGPCHVDTRVLSFPRAAFFLLRPESQGGRVQHPSPIGAQQVLEAATAWIPVFTCSTRAGSFPFRPIDGFSSGALLAYRLQVLPPVDQSSPEPCSVIEDSQMPPFSPACRSPHNPLRPVSRDRPRGYFPGAPFPYVLLPRHTPQNADRRS
ncbi:hypothetical protein SAMN04488087_2042 [Rhodothermus profundi]|uniref:Uncharacterized protein n=1 Tax=Rhodothermus profundi TaxID=633813 RepID=A0A1M6VHQ8_9BACT|nr:hypothetical protein SAMN04488087_2042 [Rhodothermus profundi]